MWHFYLEYSRAGFGSGYIDVNQLTFSRPDAVIAQPIAQRLEEALRPFLKGDLPVRLKAWDGSVAGPGGRARWSCSPRPTSYAGCCGTRASSGPPRPT